ncbi:hypothetical protein FHS00_000175 [Limimaricola variabilis]|uniref:Uncharacterized protein n=1 Tax=Limimaricola variabilis TaxID=1492771 RepID=A0ABR6HJG5_9RHOB|nr:hypothetical protein [Limimaricola variabilis]MBB3710622.1 hypothetical protein [Limimaricola variabilis]
MRQHFIISAAAVALSSTAALAEPIAFEAILAPTDEIRMEFGDDSKHFLLMVRREGEATGDGMFDGARVVEHGYHDIMPPSGGDPQGYLEVTTDAGDIAYLKWIVRAVFVKGEEGPRLIDYGHWEMVSGTGALAGMTGVGTLQIKPASETERTFVVEGEIGEAP